MLAVGASLLWAVCGWRWWTELLRLAGLAYFLGVAALIVVSTLELVVGIPFGLATLLVTGSAIAGAGLVVGALRGRSRLALRPPGGRPLVAPALAVCFAVTILVFFAGLFRSVRAEPLGDSDSWWVWTIRAKALYLFGDLGGNDLVRGDISSYPSYPPGLSLLQAQAFEAMGSIDTVTLHVQHWFLAVGFVAAVLGLLVGRVRAPILLPFVLLALVMPGFADRVGTTRADCLLGYLLALAALLLYFWLEDRSRWRLVSATVLLAGAVLTKREGAALVLCVLAAAFVASLRERGWAWPRLASVGVAVIALSAPWRVYLVATDVRDAPTGGYLAFLDHVDRALPSLGLVVRTIFDPMWLGLSVFTVVATALALAVGSRRLPIFVCTFLATAAIGSAFVIWSETSFEITREPSQNPVIRMVLVILLVLAPLIPLLFETAWRSSARDPSVGSG